jgi:hypothetical protein
VSWLGREERVNAGVRVMLGVGVEERVVLLEDEEESGSGDWGFGESDGRDASRMRAGMVWRIEEIFCSRWSSVDLAGVGLCAGETLEGDGREKEGDLLGLDAGRGIEDLGDEIAWWSGEIGVLRVVGKLRIEARLLDRRGSGGEEGYSRLLRS